MDGKMKENAKKAIGEIISMTELKSPAELRAAAEHSMRGFVSVLFGEKAFLADNGGWAIVEPGGQDVPQLRPFPGKKRVTGLPRWNGGKLVAVSGGDRAASIWDFSDVENPRLVRWFTLPCATEAASFWRDTFVIPGRLQGVLIGK